MFDPTSRMNPYMMGQQQMQPQTMQAMNQPAQSPMGPRPDLIRNFDQRRLMQPPHVRQMRPDNMGGQDMGGDRRMMLADLLSKG